MINLPINSQKAKTFYKSINTKDGNYKSKTSRLQELINNKRTVNPNDLDILVLRHIKNILKNIIISTPKGLEIIIKEFELKGYQDRIYNSNTNKTTKLGDEIRDLFNYKSFRSASRGINLGKVLNVKSCSTCNTQYTLNTSSKALYHFDHYYPKSVYPYLSLSFYNLLPCCANCNMGKSDKAFNLTDNIHPYEESFHRIAKFNIDRYSLTEFLIDPKKKEDSINYEIGLRAKYFGNIIYENKLKNYIKEYRIEIQYEHFKDIAAEIYLKSRYYHKKKRKELRDFFKNEGIDLNEQQIRRFIVGNYTEEKDILKRPLAKFMTDISSDLIFK
jgi:hypothetical protein